jgi:hypothetical protein
MADVHDAELRRLSLTDLRLLLIHTLCGGDPADAALLAALAAEIFRREKETLARVVHSGGLTVH